MKGGSHPVFILSVLRQRQHTWGDVCWRLDWKELKCCKMWAAAGNEIGPAFRPAGNAIQKGDADMGATVHLFILNSSVQDTRFGMSLISVLDKPNNCSCPVSLTQSNYSLTSLLMLNKNTNGHIHYIYSLHILSYIRFIYRFVPYGEIFFLAAVKA